MMRKATLLRVTALLFCAQFGTIATSNAQANGLNFDGANDFVNIGTPLAAGSSYTKEAWVFLTGSGDRNIISSNQNPFWIRGVRLSAGNSLDFVEVEDPVAFPTSTWTHAAVSYDADTRIMRLYKNGALVATKNNANSYTGNTIDLGRYINVSYFNGTLDEIRIWNRSLCQAEIQNNMNGELPNPTTQTGLVSYYKMNQGTASGTNTGLTNVLDASASGNNGTAFNFALTGSTSNWVTGAPAVTGNGPQYVPASLSAAAETITRTVSGATPFAGCGAILSATPGTLTGSVKVKLRMDATVQSFTGNAYVQRHFDIEPATAPNTATGTVTLYYSQAEFTAYNASNGADPDLPIDAADAANNKANLRITQFHGTSASGTPGTYSGWAGAGPAIIVITPSSVTWNATDSRWEAVIPVTGFSGFFAAGTGLSGGVPLPVELLLFSAEKTSAGNLLSWMVAKEEGSADYSIERSTDGRHFSGIAAVRAAGKSAYRWLDAQPFSGISYYRLRISGAGGDRFSEVRDIKNVSGSQVTVHPSHTKDYVVIENCGANVTALISDVHGRQLSRFEVRSGAGIDLTQYAPGLYMLRLSSGEYFRIVKN